MSLQVSGARFVLHPQCVHLQVSCASDPARMSTDRHAAGSILSRALIGSSIHVRSFCTCGNSFRHIYCSVNFGFSCGSKSCKLSTANHWHHATIDSQCHTGCILAGVSIYSPITFAYVTRSSHHVSIALSVERCEFSCAVQRPHNPFLKRRRPSSFASHRSQDGEMMSHYPVLVHHLQKHFGRWLQRSIETEACSSASPAMTQHVPHAVRSHKAPFQK